MDRLLRILKKHFITSLVSTGLAMVFVWLLGPYIAIAGKVFLHTPVARIWATAAVFLCWLGYFGIRMLVSHGSIMASTMPTDLEEQHSRLANEIKAVYHAVKQLKSAPLPQPLPLFICLGRTRCGRHNLFKHAGCTNLTEALEESEQSHLIEWWQYQTFLIATPKDELSEKQWQSWLALLQRHPKLTVAGIIVTIGFPHIFDESIREEENEREKNQLSLLHYHFGRIPIISVITQCDLIEGFSEFFDDLSSEERAGRFGLDLPSISKYRDPIKMFHMQYRSFIATLSDRLIHRLHQEPNPSVRNNLSNLLLQFEALQPYLLNTFTHWPYKKFRQLRGVYFTSSKQKGDPFNFLLESVRKNLSLMPPHPRIRPALAKPYFITALMSELQHIGENHTPPPKPRSVLQLTTYPLAAFLLSMSMLWLNHGYEANNETIKLVNKELLLFAANTDSSNQSWIAKLSALNIALKSLQQQEENSKHWLVLNQTSALSRETAQAYKKALSAVFLPYLDQKLVNALKQNNIASNEDVSNLYSATKIALMLEHPHLRDERSILEWYRVVWQNEYPTQPQQQEILSYHLQQLLAQTNITWPQHDALIQQAQTTLRDHSLIDLTYIVLEDQTRASRLPINFDTNGTLDNSLRSLPAIYTRIYVNQVYNQIIPSLCQALRHGDWVTGRKIEPGLNDADIQALTQQVQKVYLTHYLNYWQNINNTIQVTQYRTLEDIQKQLKLLEQPHSPFWEWLQLIADNTTPTATNFDFNNTVAQHFESLQLIATHHDAISSLIPLMQHYDNYLSKILSIPNRDQACYAAAADRMSQDVVNDDLEKLMVASQALPAPMNAWLKQLLDSSWDIILTNAKQYINELWVNNVVPEYDSRINHRYPLFADASNEISRSDFIHFFGPNGTIDSFFNYYLKPFVDTSQFYWDWKEVDGKKMPISQPTLEMFIRASLIEKMFFPTTDQLLQIKFRLTPLKLSEGLDSFTLNIDGQVIEFSRTNIQPTILIWPGTTPSFVSMQFKTTSGDIPSLSASGDWAWFRILSRSDVSKTDSTKQYMVTFRIGKEYAIYELDADSMINPYIPDILTSFRCPNVLKDA